jgi:hypothetical protein
LNQNSPELALTEPNQQVARNPMNYFLVLHSPSVSHFAATYRDYSYDFVTTPEWEISSAAGEV